MNKEKINPNFDINAKCQSMIEEANKIIKVYLETSNLYEEDGGYSLVYDVKNYLPKLQQENKQLKEDNFKLQARADKYKHRNDKAIEYIRSNSAFINDDEYEVFNKKELLEILKGGE